MAVQVQLRRGTKEQNDLFTGVVAELTYDTSNGAIRTHDGTTVGGKELLFADLSNISVILNSNSISGLAASATTDTTNADNISSGTLNANRLANSGVTADTYGSSTEIPVITIDSKGRITTASTTSISTTISLAGSIGTGSVAGGGTLTITGTNGITSSASGSQITIGVDSTITTLTGSQTLTNKTISGNDNTLTDIDNSSLVNSSITVGTTSISLGSSSTTLSGLTSVSSTSFIGDVTGQVSSLDNHDTDDLSEGSTNLYYTTSRANTDFDNRLQAKTTTNLAEGSNLYYTEYRFDTSFSGKDTDDLVEGSTNLYYTTSRANTDFDNRLLSITTDDLVEGSTNLYYTTSRFDTRLGTKTTDDLSEGSNLYYTDSRFDTRLSTKSTSDLSEGSNLYYTDSRFDTRLGTKTTSDLSEGSNLYFTEARSRQAISVVDTGGDGSLDYNQSTGIITYNGPGATEVRQHFSAGTGITLTNGSIAVDSTIATKTYADNAASAAVAAVIDAAPSTLDTLNELAAALGDDANFSTTITNSIGDKLNSSDFNSTFDARLATKTTDDVDEGSTNLYYTDSRFDARLATKTTDDVDEGSTNLYYTTSRANTDFNSQLLTKSTSDLSEGTNLYYTTSRVNSDFDTRLGTKSTTDLSEGTNLYYTDSRFDTRLGTKSTTDLSEGTNLYYTTSRVNTDFDTRLGTKTTDNLTEGSTNLYYTSSRANTDFDTRLGTKTTSDLSEGSNLYYTSSRANTDFDTRLGTKTTDNLTEGSTNLYYTTSRVNSDFDTRLGTKSTTDVSEGSNLYYTSSRANTDFDTRLGTKTTTDLSEGSNLYYTDTRVDNYLTANNYATELYVDNEVSVKAPINNPTFTGIVTGTFVGDLTGNADTVTNGVYTTDVGTVTNAMLSGSISNSKLTNSYITINGIQVSLGGSTSVTAAAPNALTIGSGLVGSSYDGSSAVTITIDSSVVTLTESQTLTNKTLTAPSIGGLVEFTDTTDSTSSSDGSVTFAGGVGITKKLYVGSDLNVAGGMYIDGNLTVTGTTFTVNAHNLAVKDNMIYLNDGSETANPDLGIAGNYNDGTYQHAGIFRDASDGIWKFYDSYLPEPDASPNIDTTDASFNLAPILAGSVTAATFTGDLVGNASTATTWETTRTIALSGDVSGSASIDGSGDITITTTIQPNSVTLGTDTTGNYMVDVSAGTGISVSHTPSEGSTATITNTGVISTIAGSGIGVSSSTGDVTITNSDKGSSQNIFKNFTDGTNTSTADTNNDTFKIHGSNGVTVTITNDDSTHGDSALISLSSVPNSSLANSSLTIGSTSISLGGSSTTLAGLTSVTATTFIGNLTGNADTASSSTNISGGSTGALPYNTSSGVTSFLSLGTSGYVLVAGANSPSYVTQSSLSVGTAQTLATSRTINGVSFDGSADISFGTDSISEGTTNLYHTSARVRAAISAGTGISYNSSTGVITNTITQYTDTLARLSISAGTGISYNSSTGVITNTITQYTDSLARLSISAGTGISYNSSTGVISSDITQYTDSLARLSISAGTGISYNSSTGVITNTITQYTDTSARAALSHTTGSAGYNSSTGVITIPANTSDLTNDSGYATETYVNTQISNLVDSAPSTLNTLNELAAALGDDANYAATISTALGLKANSADLATVATSGSYTDLTDTPTIPSLTGYATETYVNNFGIGAATVTTASSHTMDSFAASQYTTAKYLIQGTNGSDIHSTEVTLIHNGTTVYMTEYGTVSTATLFTVDASITSGNVVVSVTTSNNNTTIDFKRTLLVSRL